MHYISEGLTKYCDRLLGIIEAKCPNSDISLSAEMKAKFSQSAEKEKLNISGLDCKKRCEVSFQTFRTSRDLNDHIQSQHKGERFCCTFENCRVICFLQYAQKCDVQ